MRASELPRRGRVGVVVGGQLSGPLGARWAARLGLVRLIELSKK